MIRRPKRIIKSEQLFGSSAGKIPYILSRSSGRRTLSIHIDEKAALSVAVPFTTSERDIHAFLREKDQWIIKCITEAQKNQAILTSKEFDEGGEFLFLGKKCVIHVLEDDIKRSRINFEGTNWCVTTPKGLNKAERQKLIKDKLTNWYRSQAEEIIGGRLFHYARAIGVEPKKIGIRTQKRMWGCCNYTTQSITINWQIILSPIKVVDYVVVHELCHLIHPNHSKRFWAKVEKHMPDYREYKKWLSVNHMDMMLP